MPLFGFADITFNKPGTGGAKGPLRALEGTQFDSRALRYPIDIGNYDKGHYVVLYIRQQKNTAYKKATVDESEINSPGGVRPGPGGIPNLSSAASSLGSQLLGQLNSGLSQLNSATGGALSGVTNALSSAAAGAVGAIDNLFGQASTLSGSGQATSSIIDNSIKKISDSSFLQTTELTTDAIALYMPDTLTYQYQQGYDQLSIGNEIGGQALAASRSALDKFKDEGALEGLMTLGKAAATTGKRAVIQATGTALGSQQTGQLAAAALLGSVTNPMLEMIYKSPNFRTFQYDFMFYPRDEREAYEVQKIIERLRFHQAPEFAQESQGFLIPPSEFEIRFYYGGAQNPNLPQIGRCVLTSIDTNYAPNGWSAYEIPGENAPAIGRTGMPTAIQLTLQFQEVVYLTKQDFKDDSLTGGGERRGK